jgi:hypothetical protein
LGGQAAGRDDGAGNSEKRARHAAEKRVVHGAEAD